MGIRVQACCTLWFAACSLLRLGQAADPPSIVLSDVTAQSGIHFLHTDGSDGRHFLIESMSAGLALTDYDGDGDLDIYFLNGTTIAKPRLEPALTNALYRNEGGMRFREVTPLATVEDAGFGLGVAGGDFDNDGFPDIYLNNYGPNVLYHNNGDGTYSEIAAMAGVVNGHRVGAGASFFDMDADGDLDLYVGNYVKFDEKSHRVHLHKGVPSYPSPLGYDPEPDTLYRNEGDGTFRDVTEVSGIGTVAGRSMGLVTLDFDRDEDIDVFIANDAQENFLFTNDGKGAFQETGFLSGVALDYSGRAQASMGVDVLDVDRDGWQDLYVTSFSGEFATLYRNLGNGAFEDATIRSGGSAATFPVVKWGVVAADFDCNGTRDLLVAAGNLDDHIDQRGGTSSDAAFAAPNILLETSPTGKLTDLGRRWGTGASVKESTRGLVAADLDGDGRPDVVASNSRSRPTLYHNESRPVGFLVLRLVGLQSNRDALGAAVTVEQKGVKQHFETRSGHSYQSDSSPWLQVGLPDALAPVDITIRWPASSQVTRSQSEPGAWMLLLEPPAGAAP